MSYLVEHPWDRFGSPPTPGVPYDAIGDGRVRTYMPPSRERTIRRLARRDALDDAINAIQRKPTRNGHFSKAAALAAVRGVR